MKFTKPLFFLVPLLLPALACSLTNQPAHTPQSQVELAAVNAPAGFGMAAQPTIKHSVSPAQAPKTCQVKTGLPDGRLNLRACGGPACPILETVHEGEILTQVSPSATAGQDGWLEVVTTSGLTGWVKSRFCKNLLNKEVTK